MGLGASQKKVQWRGEKKFEEVVEVVPWVVSLSGFEGLSLKKKTAKLGFFEKSEGKKYEMRSENLSHREGAGGGGAAGARGRGLQRLVVWDHLGTGSR